MNSRALFIRTSPRDPVVSRDGRPFGSFPGARMKSLQWVLPSALAGSFRTMLGKLAGGFRGENTSELIQFLRDCSIQGGFPVVDNCLYLPTPRDLLKIDRSSDVNKSENSIYRLQRPIKEWRSGEGMDLSFAGGATLLPVLPEVHEGEKEDYKSDPLPDFMSFEAMIQHLSEPENVGVFFNKINHFLKGPQEDRRFHVKIKGEQGAAEDGMLFSSSALDFGILQEKENGIGREWESMQLALRVVESEKSAGDQVEKNIRSLFPESGNEVIHPLGGERRIAGWKEDGGLSKHWKCPDKIRESLQALKNTEEKCIRMILASPALFDDGWKPGWLQLPKDKIKNSTIYYEGSPPGAPDSLQLRLIGAIMDRWKPVSGWSLEEGKTGAKPVRRMVPAGSVYFFQVIKGNPGDLANLWLESVSDQAQDQRDGFGLSLWGIY